MLSTHPICTQDVAKGAGKEVILGDQRIEELFEQIGVAWKEVSGGFFCFLVLVPNLELGHPGSFLFDTCKMWSLFTSSCPIVRRCELGMRSDWQVRLGSGNPDLGSLLGFLLASQIMQFTNETTI